MKQMDFKFENEQQALEYFGTMLQRIEWSESYQEWFEKTFFKLDSVIVDQEQPFIFNELEPEKVAIFIMDNKNWKNTYLIDEVAKVIEKIGKEKFSTIYLSNDVRTRVEISMNMKSKIADLRMEDEHLVHDLERHFPPCMYIVYPSKTESPINRQVNFLHEEYMCVVTPDKILSAILDLMYVTER